VVSLWILLRMKPYSDKTCRENQNTHILCGVWDSVAKIWWRQREGGGTDDIIRDKKKERYVLHTV
jgi:hypothetical protein